MRGAAGRLLIVIFFLSIANTLAFSETIISPFNRQVLDLDDDSGTYSFTLSGHLYGSPLNKNSIYPASTFLANIDTLNSLGSSFFIALGDIFWGADNARISAFKGITAKLKVPVFNALGNHDVTNRKLYYDNFGDETYYHFKYNKELFIILDTEIDRGKISGDQLEFFFDIIEKATNDSEVNNVFIFSHRLIWSIDNPAYRIVYEHVNNKDGYSGGNFETTIKPALLQLANHKNIYWFSGDIGVQGSLPLFYDEEEGTGITYIGVGIGDTKMDAILNVRVTGQGNVSITPVSLAGEELLPLPRYGPAYWNDHFKARLDIRSVSFRITRVLKHKYFWTGMALMAFLYSSALVLFKRIRR